MSSTVVIASTASDSAAAEAMVAHHTEMVARCGALVDELIAAVSDGDGHGSAEARDRLVRWSRRDLLPHASAEEDALYAPAQALTEGRRLITAMRAEHRAISRLIERLAATESPIEACAAAAALREVFTGHVWKENEIVVPMLAEESTVSLTDALAAMHEAAMHEAAMHEAAMHEALAAGEEPEIDAAAGHGACGCGEHAAASADGDSTATCGCGGHEHGAGAADAVARPVLDARSVPHAIRHATVFGALDAVRQGRGLELIAPHDPLPLLAQIERRNPGVFEVSYLERGPESWRLAIDRRADREASRN